MFIKWPRPLLIGVFLWTAGTIGIRFSAHGLLRADHGTRTIMLYLASFLLMAILVPRICKRLGIQREAWPGAATLLILPTLILDPFSCAFFPAIFPNLDPAVAGIFGGWMLICCGGGIAGVLIKV